MTERQSTYDIKTILAALNDVCLVALVASFQLNRKWLFSISLICFGLSFLAEYVCLCGWQGWRWRRADAWFVSLVALWLVFPLSLPLTGGGPVFRHDMEKNLSFLLIGVMGLMHSPRKVPLRIVAWTFVITSVVINIAVLLLTDWNEAVSNPQHLMAIETARITYFGAHIRFNLCQNMALISAAYIICKAQRRKERIVAAGALPFILLMTFTSQGRIGIITAIVLTAGLLLLWLRGRSRLLAALATIAMFVAGALFMQSMQSMHEYDKLSEKIITEEPRIKLWNAACDVISEHPMGMGVDKGMEEFHLKCAVRQAMTDTHTHNLWLQYSLYFGVIGFLLITAVLLMPPFVVEDRKRLMVIFALLPFLLEGMVDVFGAGIPSMMLPLSVWTIIES